MSLKANEVELRMYESEDYVDALEESRGAEARECWTSIKSSHLDLFLKQGIYNTRCDMLLGDTSIVENKIYKGEMIHLPH